MPKKMTHIEFVEKVKKIYKDEYIVIGTYIKDSEKIEILHKCMDGKQRTFKIRPGNFTGKNKNGCKYCATIRNANKHRKTLEQFKQEVYNLVGDEYIVVGEYINSDTCIKMFHSKCKSFISPIPYNFLAGFRCIKCSGNMKGNIEKFRKLNNVLHGEEYTILSDNYKTTHKPVLIRHNACRNEFRISYTNFKAGYGCPKCSNTGISKKEVVVSNYTKSIYSGEIITNTKSIISPLELDIYIPEFNLAIEFDGLYWHSDKHLDNDYHLNKTNLCKEKGIRLIHIFEDEWDFKKDIVKARIKHALNICDYKVYARECQVFEIDSLECKEFLNNYHIQGNCQSSIKLGLYLGEELVAVMTFGKSRFSKDYEWELLRYCCIPNHNVIGGAGKLLKAFERGWKPKNIISYCDLRWGNGGLYKALGFEYSHNSKPAYQYFKENSLIRESRIKYQKHKLVNILEEFNSSLSEYKNMINHGYLRVYDCGNMVFIKNNI